ESDGCVLQWDVSDLTRKPRKVATVAGPLAYTPDGKFLAAAAPSPLHKSGARTGNIYLYDLSGSVDRLHAIYTGIWSPDEDDIGRNEAMWRMSPDGSSPCPLPQEPPYPEGVEVRRVFGAATCLDVQSFAFVEQDNTNESQQPGLVTCNSAGFWIWSSV